MSEFDTRSPDPDEVRRALELRMSPSLALLAAARQWLREREQPQLTSFDFHRVLAWARATDRPKAHAAFTAGIEREIADLIEMLPQPCDVPDCERTVVANLCYEHAPHEQPKRRNARLGCDVPDCREVVMVTLCAAHAPREQPEPIMDDIITDYGMSCGCHRTRGFSWQCEKHRQQADTPPPAAAARSPHTCPAHVRSPLGPWCDICAARMELQPQPAPALSIGQVIAACGPGELVIYRDGLLRWNAEHRYAGETKSYAFADTPEDALQALGEQSITKLREQREQADAALKKLGK